MLNVNNVYKMNNIDGLKLLDDNSIDSIVTDPPYELGFMGKKWDNTGIAYSIEFWKECFRVLKHGGHLLSFGGTRTYHRMACAIEDAGFEIRDQIQWIYGSGFPKSSDITKQLKKKGINEKEWVGWGTSLKPAHEPIVMARKPLSEETVVDNVLKWSVGVINIDESRIEATGSDYGRSAARADGVVNKGEFFSGLKSGDELNGYAHKNGRFPANVIFDEEAGRILDEQSGTLKSGNNAVRKDENAKGYHGNWGTGQIMTTYGDTGGASRFFYCAKASKKEKGDFNTHPTVKPMKLMEYLVRLVTPKNGIVLDPFTGSGSTLVAAKNLGFDYIGFEMEEEYIEIANKRLDSEII